MKKCSFMWHTHKLFLRSVVVFGPSCRTIYKCVSSKGITNKCNDSISYNSTGFDSFWEWRERSKFVAKLYRCKTRQFRFVSGRIRFVPDVYQFVLLYSYFYETRET